MSGLPTFTPRKQDPIIPVPGMTPEVMADAALACARRMATYCAANGYLKKYSTIEQALSGIANEAIGFGDLCDDNLFYHEVLSGLGLIPGSVSEFLHDDDACARWNAIVDLMPWAARTIAPEYPTGIGSEQVGDCDCTHNCNCNEGE